MYRLTTYVVGIPIALLGRLQRGSPQLLLSLVPVVVLTPVKRLLGTIGPPKKSFVSFTIEGLGSPLPWAPTTIPWITVGASIVVTLLGDVALVRLVRVSIGTPTRLQLSPGRVPWDRVNIIRAMTHSFPALGPPNTELWQLQAYLLISKPMNLLLIPLQ